MPGGQLANLFVDITLRGGAKAQLKDIKERIESSDRALAKNAVFYKAVTGEKIRQMSKLAENQYDLAKIDKSTYGSMPYANYADKEKKADVETEIAGKQKSIALSQGEIKALKGKQGIELAGKTMQEGRIKKQVEEIKNHNMMVAQYGKIGASIMQAGKGLSGVLSKMPNLSLGGLMGMGVAGLTVGHAVSQASPLHMETLTKSFDLLAASIGMHLLPMIDFLSVKMQGLSTYIEKSAIPSSHAFSESIKLHTEAFTSLEGFGRLLGTYLGIIPAGTQRGKNKDDDKEPDRPATKPAHFESFDQSWRRIQQEAASTGTLEQRTLDIQMRILEATNRVVVNTAPGNTPAPPPPLPGQN